MLKRLAIAVLAGLAVSTLVWRLHNGAREQPYTGFVEGEERVIRSQVTGRVLEVRFGEGETVPARAVIARLADTDLAARVATKEAELAMLGAEIARPDEQIRLIEATWRRELAAREAEVRLAAAAAERAERSFAREVELVRTGASTAQRLDDERATRDQARSALQRARELLGRTQAEERQIPLARQQREVILERRRVAEAELAALEVERAKFTIEAPDVPTVVQTQFLWPGELAQPGTPVMSVLDPQDKYVLLYAPVEDVAAFRVGRRVEVELDSVPGERIPGEVVFVADTATFTPEKIETREDRLGQVYRVKIRIRGDTARLQPGTEGDVWLMPDPPSR